MAAKNPKPKPGEATSVPKAKTKYTDPAEEPRSRETQAAADRYLGSKPPAEPGGK